MTTSNILTDSVTTYAAHGHLVSGSDPSGSISISEHNLRYTASGSNETKINLVQINQALQGQATVAQLVVSGGISGSLTRLHDGTSYLIEGANTTITSASNGSITIASAAGASGPAGPTQWIDDGVTLGSTGSVHVDGALTASLGFSGSLTKLVDGTSYLIAGTNVTITSASNGAVTIASSDAVGESRLWVDQGANGVSQTGSVAISAEGGDVSNYGSDVHLVVTGTNVRDTSLFEQKVHVSGTMFVSSTLTVVGLIAGDNGMAISGQSNLQQVTGTALLIANEVVANLGFSGSHTKLIDGTSAFIEGANITITSASNGAITIAGAAGGGGGSSLWSDEGTAGVSQTGSITVGGDAGVTGFISASLGFSGSLHRLTTGDPAFIAGTNIILASASNGALTITAVAGAGGLWTDEVAAGVSQTGSITVGGDAGVTGFISASLGFSGSLTKLVDGTSYLIEGANVTITSASNGAITIASALDGVGESRLWTDEGANGLSHTGSVAILSDGGNVTTWGTDVNFVVSGTQVKDTSLFIDKVHVSGTVFMEDTLDVAGLFSGNAGAIIGGTTNLASVTASANLRVNLDSRFDANLQIDGATTSNLGFSGSHTHLIDGSSAFIGQGTVTITSSSNGAIIISGTGDGGAETGGDADWIDNGNDLNTTSSVAIAANGGTVSSFGTDVFMAVSGTAVQDTALFLDKVHISGTTFMSSTLAVVGQIAGNNGMAIGGKTTLAVMTGTAGIRINGDSKFQSNLQIDGELQADGNATFQSASAVVIQVSGTADPASLVNGQMWSNSSDLVHRLYTSGTTRRFGEHRSAITMKLSGVISTGTSPMGGFRPAQVFEITNVFIETEGAPSGSTVKGVTVDVNVDGATIFSNQALRPFISASFFTGSSGAPTTSHVGARSKITWDVDTIGDAVPGSTLTVQIEGWYKDEE